jgi:AcrR family transcriptional regulator
MKALNEIRSERKKVARGEKTRAEILQAAVHIASAEGLEGLTIGRLADELELSKSGLFAHFGSKEELQIAVVGKARDIFVREVVQPALTRDRGLSRLIAFLDEWLLYMGRKVFRGGCFFMASAIEFDSRPGAVRNLIAELSKSWLDTLRGEIAFAQSAGQLDPKLDSRQLAFELHALAHAANWAYQLFKDENAFELARAGIGRRLQADVTAEGLKHLEAHSRTARAGAASRERTPPRRRKRAGSASDKRR